MTTISSPGSEILVRSDRRADAVRTAQHALSDPGPARRWHDLDALRGFAMLLGIGVHAVRGWGGGGPSVR